MKFAELNNGIKMPMVGLGVFKVEDAAECAYAVKTALKLGYRSIDTATVYQNEEAVGVGIKESGVPREEMFITTKVWNEDQRKGNVINAFENSLKALGLDYIDLYLIHWPVKEHYINTWQEIEKIYESGRAKAIGVSNFQDYHIAELKKVWKVVPAVNQFECHPYLSQKPLIELCIKEGILPEAYSPLGAVKNGLLEDEIILSIAKKYSVTAAQVVLRWDIQCGLATIPKSTNESRIKENIDIFSFELNAADMAEIDSLNKNERVRSDPDTFTF